MSHTYRLYLIRQTSTGLAYVGQTVQEIRYRFTQHRLQPSLVGVAMRASGDHNFSLQLLGTFSSKEDAAVAERNAILHHNTLHPNGFNRHTGGEKGGIGFEYCEESFKAVSQNRKGNTCARATGVCQYTESGKLVATFRSIKQASEKTGVHRTHINRTVRHRPNDTAGGYRWSLAQ